MAGDVSNYVVFCVTEEGGAMELEYETSRLETAEEYALAHSKETGFEAYVYKLECGYKDGGYRRDDDQC